MSLAEAMRAQARACAGLGSPFMDRLLRLLADRMPRDSTLWRTCAGWPGDPGPSGASMPLRLAGGLHALVLTGRAPGLTRVYPPGTPSDADLADAVLEALETHEAELLDWIQRPPQTNEVRRSVALIAAAHWLAARHSLPFILSELGASGGLNLNFDRFRLQAGSCTLGPTAPALTLSPDWRGAPPPAPADVRVTERRGVDLFPIDATSDDGRLRLRAYLWPDQPNRRALTDAAITVQRATVDTADAIDWLAGRVATPRPGHLHLIYHTVAWQYFPEAAQARGKALIEAAGAGATPDAPLAWLAMENDGDKRGAALTLRLWPGNAEFALGRADFHGQWIDWQAD